ncbi:MAG: ribosome assembly RNA-binding protein YhbY [Lautropia sp.]|nr:ribosome assembly RNA-binding protein YhbY [Lautropia sp.]
MPTLLLTNAERRELKARAHSLNPVVMVGAAGLTPPVLQEIDRGLASHELMKVRLSGAKRKDREQAAEDIAEALSCAVVHIIGHVLVLFRPLPEED